MKLEAEIAEAGGLKAPIHHLQRSHLLTHEEDALTRCESVGDQISDRLRLARARRPLHHEIMAPSDGSNGPQLARIGIHYLEGFLRRKLIVESHTRDVLRQAKAGIAAVSCAARCEL